MADNLIWHDCECGDSILLKIYDSGSGYNSEFGQTEHWFSAEGKCPSCGIEHDISDSSL